jgi:hypothetical protein
MEYSAASSEAENYIEKGSDDGVSYSELLGFWIFSIVRYSRN